MRLETPSPVAGAIQKRLAPCGGAKLTQAVENEPAIWDGT
jgi:hypothetical protein